MKLTDHFTLEELVFSSTALRLGIDNTPSPEIVNHLLIAATGMEHVRELLGNIPIHVDSGYRCLELNSAVNGAPHSAHMQGYAVDFICPKFGDPKLIVQAIASSDIQFDRCIYEGHWVHISFDPKLRREVETATFTKDGPVYTKGVA